VKASRRVLLLAIGAALLSAIALRQGNGEWAGVDEAVIGRFVSAAGRKPLPVIDWVQGDLLLFAFLCAGLIAGFVLGFYGRGLFADGAGQAKDHVGTER
jgi:cobalt/nickel transport protein